MHNRPHLFNNFRCEIRGHLPSGSNRSLFFFSNWLIEGQTSHAHRSQNVKIDMTPRTLLHPSSNHLLLFFYCGTHQSLNFKAFVENLLRLLSYRDKKVAWVERDSVLPRLPRTCWYLCIHWLWLLSCLHGGEDKQKCSLMIRTCKQSIWRSSMHASRKRVDKKTSEF